EMQAGWSDDDGEWWVDQIELVPREGERERLGLNLNLEFRPRDDFQLYVRTIFNEFSESMKRQEYIIETRSDPEWVNETETTFDRMRFSQRTFERVRDQSLRNITIGGERNWGRSTLSLAYTYSYAEESI